MMTNSHLKYCSLHIGADTYHYILNTDTDTVYTQDFPDIAIEKFRTACGLLVTPQTIALIIREKLGLPLSKTNYEDAF
jgi:hypothetical protein